MEVFLGVGLVGGGGVVPIANPAQSYPTDSLLSRAQRNAPYASVSTIHLLAIRLFLFLFNRFTFQSEQSMNNKRTGSWEARRHNNTITCKARTLSKHHVHKVYLTSYTSTQFKSWNDTWRKILTQSHIQATNLMIPTCLVLRKTHTTIDRCYHENKPTLLVLSISRSILYCINCTIDSHSHT